MATIKIKQPNGEVATAKISLRHHLPPTLEAVEKNLRFSLGLPIYKRMAGAVPYGYMYDANLNVYQPNQEIFKLLWKARQYLLTNHSLREVVIWLNSKAEKIGIDSLSHVGLEKLMITRPPFEQCLLSQEEKEKIIYSLCQWNQTNH